METINKRFKLSGILRKVYRDGISSHGDDFRSIAIITHLAIDIGEPLIHVLQGCSPEGVGYYDKVDLTDIDEDLCSQQSWHYRYRKTVFVPNAATADKSNEGVVFSGKQQSWAQQTRMKTKIAQLPTQL